MSADRGPVLAGIDAGPGTASVLIAAARLAEVGNRRLVIAIVAPLATAAIYPDAPMICPDEDDTLATVFPDVCDALLDSDVDWSLLVTCGSPASQLMTVAEQTGAVAIVVGADTAGLAARLRRGLQGSVPRQLIKGQRAPVIVVPAGCSHPPRGVRRRQST